MIDNVPKMMVIADNLSTLRRLFGRAEAKLLHLEALVSLGGARVLDVWREEGRSLANKFLRAAVDFCVVAATGSLFVSVDGGLHNLKISRPLTCARLGSF